MIPDIAGSIRIPGICCGTYAFKPTTGRIPYGGQVSPAALGMPGIEPCAGPLANSMADIKLLVTNVLTAKPWLYDSSANAVPWRTDVLTSDLTKRPLTIGVLAEEAAFPLHPPVRRAIHTATKALEAAGHKVVELPLDPSTSMATANAISFKYFGIDPNATGIKYIFDSGEPMVPSVTETIRKVTLAGAGPTDIEYTLPFLMSLNVQRSDFAESWRKLYNAHSLDAVICPGAQNTAVPHDTYGLAPYTAIWNCLDWPACIIPHGKADRKLDPEKLDISFPPALGPDYVPDVVDGAPTCVQLVTPRFMDEECLAIAGVVDDVLGKGVLTL